MRNVARVRRGLLASGVAVSLLVLPASGASASTILHFHGTGEGHQSQARIKFKVLIKHGKPRYAFDFSAAKLKAPFATPPVPNGGRSSTLCRRGRTFSYTFGALEEPPPLDANKIHFEPDHPNLFYRETEFPGAPDPPADEWMIHGGIAPPDKHVHHWEAEGSIVLARSEGGLTFGGCSTGRFLWNAHTG